MIKIEPIFFNHNCNSYLIINNNKVILVDPGFNNNNCLINYINKKNLVLTSILITHGHFDHIEGLKTIKDIPIYIHKDEIEFLYNARLNCSLMSGEEFIIEDVNIIPIEDDETLKLNDIEIKVIHTPFHTIGSCCFYIKDINTLLSGDTLFYHSIGRTDLPKGKPHLISSSLKKIFLLPHEEENDTIVYPGHGPSTSLSREYKFFYKEFLE